MSTTGSTSAAAPGTGQPPFGAEALFGLMRVQATAVRAIDEALMDAHGAGLTGYELLSRLANLHPDGASVRYLSDQVVVSSSRVSRVTDDFVSRGLLERAASPHDGRLSLVRLTPEGRAEVRRMEATFARALHANFTGRLTRDQVAAIAGVAYALGAPNCAEVAASAADADR